MIEMTRDKIDEITSTMHEIEAMWGVMCDTVDEDRTELLIEALLKQHGLVMAGESNADAVMALVGFISRQIVYMHKDGGMTLEGAMVLLQIGMQRGVQAYLALEKKPDS